MGTFTRAPADEAEVVKALTYILQSASYTHSQHKGKDVEQKVQQQEESIRLIIIYHGTGYPRRASLIQITRPRPFTAQQRPLFQV